MYTWKERLIDWWHRVAEGLELTKGEWVCICVMAALSILMSGIVMGMIIPGIRADIARQADDFAGNLTALTSQGQAARDQLEASMTGEISDLWNALDTNLTEFGRRMGDTRTDLDGVRALVDSLNRTEPSAYLAGAFGNYTLHVMSLTGGNFTANVHLAYSPGVGNMTECTAALGYFYAGVNWTSDFVPAYVCSPSFNGTGWGISEVWFNIGAFPLVAEEWAAFNITCAGLNITWEPDFAYAEVFPVLRNG